jgi:predicted nucleic acid-binding protein
LTPPIRYLDSSIVVSYALGPTDYHYANAKQIIEKDIMKKRTIGLVSTLVLLEIIDVIRHRVTERTNKATMNHMDENTRKSYIKTESDKKITDLVNVLTQMENQGYVIFADFTPLDLKQIMDNVYVYSKKYFGLIRKYFRCRFCRSFFEHYSYRGLGWIDVMHAFLALELCADGFTTADKSFKDLQTDPQFSELPIAII